MDDRSSNTPGNADVDVSEVMYRFMLYFLIALAAFSLASWPVYRQYLDARERVAVDRLQSLLELNDNLFQRQVRELRGRNVADGAVVGGA